MHDREVAFVGMIRGWNGGLRVRKGVLVQSASQSRSLTRIPKIRSPPKYDPERLREVFGGKQSKVLRRRMQIVMPLTAFVSKVVLDVRLGREKERRPDRAREFMKLIASLGPAFVKAGQVLAMRPDLLPKEYLMELEKLQDRLPPFPKEIAMQQVENELQTNINSVFRQFDPEPVAAASIGQVYKAQLTTGEFVAVKVQRPQCEEIVSLDLYILRELSGILNKILSLLKRDIDLKNVVDEFGNLIYQEMDYTSEALNAERFSELYGNMKDIVVPRVYWRHTRRKILTLQWIEGVRITAAPEKKAHLVKTLLNCSLEQMLGNGFFHADPHGGNLLATSDGRLCFLDFGMMSTVAPSQRYGIIESVVHLVNRDWEAIVHLYVKLGFIPIGTDTKPIVQALEKGLPNVMNSSVADFNFTSVIQELGSIMYTYPFKLPKYYTAILRSMAVLEGVALRVAPGVKIVNEAYPYIAAKLLTEKSPELQETLLILLFKDGHIRKSRLQNLILSASAHDDYDMNGLLGSFMDFLFEDRNAELRDNLAEDIAVEIDEVAFEVTQYYVSLFVHSQILSRFMPFLSFMPEPNITDNMRAADGIFDSLRRSNLFTVDAAQNIFERLYVDGKGRRMGVLLLAYLIEKGFNRSLQLLIDNAFPRESAKP